MLRYRYGPISTIPSGTRWPRSGTGGATWARRRKYVKRTIQSLAAASVVAACGDSNPASNELDSALRETVMSRGLTGDPRPDRDLPSIDEPLPILGRKLFFSTSLGGDRDAACVSCHHPVLGGGDALPLSIGVEAVEPDLLGPGREHPDGDLTVPRNAPTTFNLALLERRLFWDGRVESLSSGGIRTPDTDFGVSDLDAGDTLAAAQARFPVTSQDEMRGFEFEAGSSNEALRTALAQRLANDGWGPEMEQVFGSDEVTFERIAAAIGAYEESQVFIDSPWRAYVEGDDSALSDSAKRGALLFFRSRGEGGAACASCHAGELFTDETFWAVASPQVGRGKGDGATGTSDFGRERETQDPVDRYTFRPPSLLNVAVTGPFFHSGVYEDLADAVRHHLDPVQALEAFDPASVPGAAIDDFDANTTEMLSFLETSGRVIPSFFDPMELDEQAVDDLVAFLEALTDPCVTDRACLDPWIGGPEDDVDGFRLDPIDADGRPL